MADMANRALVYRLYPDKKQETKIAETFGCVRFVYNHILDLQDTRHGDGEPYLGRGLANNYCNQVLKQDFPFLNEVDKFSLTNAIYHLDAGFQRFFKHKGGHPRYKSRKASSQSYTTNFTNGNIKVRDNHVQLPKLGRVKAVIHRLPQPGWKIKSATVTMLADRSYQVSVLFEYENAVAVLVPSEEKALGLDYKSDGLYVDSNGDGADMPHYYRLSEKKLAREQRRLARKQPGSKNRCRQKTRVACVSRHAANQRKDFLHKTSAAIAKRYDTVCVETINMRAMANKEFGNGKATLDNGYGMFLGMLDYKLAAKGGRLVRVDKWYPSSQICHVCGARNRDVRDLSVRKWICPVCGTAHDRDVNAAINIKAEGLKMLRNGASAA